MLHLTRRKKLILAVVIAAAAILGLSSFSSMVHSETADTTLTLPYTINTYGAAWAGTIAFDVSGPGDADYLVVMDTNGTVLNMRESTTAYGGSSYNIAPDTLLFQGEPQVNNVSSAPVFATHIWNFVDNITQDFPNVEGHHDIQYDPDNDTFLVLQDYTRDINGTSVLFDKILQLDAAGNTLWSWDTYDHIPLSEASPFNETSTLSDGQVVSDFTHANTLDWDYNQGIIYLNIRNTNTFYKIDQTTGDIIWACGEFGNFTLLDDSGNAVSSLWYHSHDVKEVAPDVFTMFNNDYNNNTNPDDCRSSLLELTLNETSMTAYVNWSWEAPKQYWNSYGGATVILPNGDYLGDFGDPNHQFTQNQSWDFNNTGAVLVEVNPGGQIVRTWTFPVGWYSYRVTAVTDFTLSPYASPSPTTNPTTSQNTPTPTASPTPTQGSKNPSTNITDYSVAAIIAIAIMIALAATIYLRKIKHKTALSNK